MISPFIHRLGNSAAILLWLLTAAQPRLMLAQAESTAPSAAPRESADLQNLIDQAVAAALNTFHGRKLQADQLAATLVDLRNPQRPLRASYRGHVQVYPASVVKLFYMVAVHRWLEDGRLRDTEEIRRAMRDMIVNSGNEPTHYLVDLLTSTTSGPELSAPDLEEWYYKRNAVNRYFASLDYANINVNRKPWGEGPYGREMQSVKLHAPNHRNWLTTDATARLLSEIAMGQAISTNRSAQMMNLLERDPFSTKAAVDGQARSFTGLALTPGDRLWSKAGWTSETRHDAAYIELEAGPRFVLVTFTVGHAGEREIIPAVARKIIEGLKKLP